MEVIVTDEMRDWYENLPDSEQQAIYASVGMLELFGVRLGFPYSSDLKGTESALRELRATAGSAELRVVYAFDPSRNAVLLIGGNKSGDNRFYKRIILKAERIWKKYLQGHRQGVINDNQDA